jgi:hypothetical protein
MVAWEPGPKSAIVFSICGPPGVSPHRYWFGPLLCHWPTPLKYLLLLQSDAPETGPRRCVEGGGGKKSFVIRFSLVCHVGFCRAGVPRVGAGGPSPPPPPPPPPPVPEACDPVLSPSRHRCALLKLCCFVLSLLLLLGFFFFSPYAPEVGFRRFDKWCEALDGLSIEPRVANFCLEY